MNYLKARLKAFLVLTGRITVTAQPQAQHFSFLRLFSVSRSFGSVPNTLARTSYKDKRHCLSILISLVRACFLISSSSNMRVFKKLNSVSTRVGFHATQTYHHQKLSQRTSFVGLTGTFGRSNLIPTPQLPCMCCYLRFYLTWATASNSGNRLAGAHSGR